MNRMELDESILTAYLDDELSPAERQVVEEQLKVNGHWRQLLSELESLRSLIRDLPKPVLSRSLTHGPWNSKSEPTSVIESESPTNQRNDWMRVSMARLALAASLLIGAFGLFAWRQFGIHEDRLARVESMKSESAKPESMKPESMARESSLDESVALKLSDAAAERESLDKQRGSIAGSGGFGRADHRAGGKVDQPQPVIKKELAASPAIESRPMLRQEMNRNRAPASAAPAEPLAASEQKNEPVETYYFTRANSLRQKSQADVKQDRSEDFVADQTQSRKYYFSGSHELKESNKAFDGRTLELELRELGTIDFIEGQICEFRFQRSDWSAASEALQRLGIKLPSPSAHEEAKKVEAVHDQAVSNRPPVLWGTIQEPDDWIRVLVTLVQN